MPLDQPLQGAAVTPALMLGRAVDRVANRLDDLYSPLAPGGTERAEGYLRTLQARLGLVLKGQDPAEARAWLTRSPLFAPLLDAVGQELIRGARDADTALATVEVLKAWQTVRPDPVVTATAASGSSEDLRGAMKGPGAFDLLVEVAHDFRSPLTSILFLSEALRDGHSGPVTDVQRSQLGLIYSAAFGLASIAADVMDLAKREKDLIGSEPEPFSPIEVVRSVERMVRPLVEEKGLELRVRVPEHWQASGQPHALSRILLNLTTNALKFTDGGFVELGARPLPHSRVEYYVQDTGRGITPEQRRTLFQPFKRRPEGRLEGHYFSDSGIGLLIVRRLLAAMGSELSLDSSDESGTRFSFILRGSP